MVRNLDVWSRAARSALAALAQDEEAIRAAVARVVPGGGRAAENLRTSVAVVVAHVLRRPELGAALAPQQEVKR